LNACLRQIQIKGIHRLLYVYSGCK
jgi:hypothetical protein